jgi:hypothetical protein
LIKKQGLHQHWRILWDQVSRSLMLEKDSNVKFVKRSWISNFSINQFNSAKDKGNEKVMTRSFLMQSDKDRCGPMLVTLENEDTSGRNVYSDTSKAASGSQNMWNTTCKKKIYNGVYRNSNSSSFSRATK